MADKPWSNVSTDVIGKAVRGSLDQMPLLAHSMRNRAALCFGVALPTRSQDDFEQGRLKME